MNEAMAWAVAALALCSLWAVQSWVTNRRQEREAFYKSEAIKKIAEMQGATPEPVLTLLREALAPQSQPGGSELWNWTAAHVREREAFYRAETLKKLAESQGSGAGAVLEVMREEERRSQRRIRGGLRLAGLITSAVGIGSMIFLYFYAPIPDKPVYLAGLIPTLIGAALVACSYIPSDSGSTKPPG
jgi:hypothetical protein